MAGTIRLDKLLAHGGYGTRSEIKKLLKTGAVNVSDKPVKDGGLQINPETSRITVNGEQVRYQEFIYFMLNKPPGVVSATEDTRDRTVIDVIGPGFSHFDLFPVGRLDKDTEGLLLITNDGKLAHQLLSPKKHVPKTYYCETSGTVTEEDVKAFEVGIDIGEGYVTMPAKLHIMEPGDPLVNKRAVAQVTIMEGKFHQIKRMFQAVGKKVLYLKRISMGPLKLDPSLDLGGFRELTEEELKLLRGE